MLTLMRSCGRTRFGQERGEQQQRRATAASVTATNTARQPNGTISALPVSGARIGDTLNTSITSAISRVASTPVCRSRMIARGMTITADAPSALHDAERNQPTDTRRQRAADRAGDETDQPDIERRLAADHVGDRPVDELTQAEGKEE